MASSDRATQDCIQRYQSGHSKSFVPCQPTELDRASPTINHTILMENTFISFVVYHVRKVVPTRTMLIAFVAGGHLCAAEKPEFAPIPEERYASMLARSPFALASPAPASAPPAASFATNWYIVGLGQLGGENFVTIKSRDLKVQFSIFGQESWQGVTLVSVNWSEATGKSTAILSRGAEVAKLEFNEAEMRTSTAAADLGTGFAQTSVNGNGALASDVRGRIPPQVARWMSPTTERKIATKIMQSVRRIGVSTGSGTLRTATGTSQGQSSPATLPVLAEAAYQDPTHQQPTESRASSEQASADQSAPNARYSGPDPRLWLNPLVAQWLSPHMQKVVMERKALLLSNK